MDRQQTIGTMSEAELAQLLSNVRAGNVDAWGELYRQYAPAIFRFCRRVLPAREDAEIRQHEAERGHIEGRHPARRDPPERDGQGHRDDRRKLVAVDEQVSPSPVRRGHGFKFSRTRDDPRT